MLHHLLLGLSVTATEIGVPSSTSDIGAGLGNAIKLIMGIMGGLAIVFLLIGSIQMALSAGDTKRYTDARNTILYAVVGLVVAIGAYAIVTFVTTYVH